jgi:hypothetical protein
VLYTYCEASSTSRGASLVCVCHALSSLATALRQAL